MQSSFVFIPEVSSKSVLRPAFYYQLKTREDYTHIFPYRSGLILNRYCIETGLCLYRETDITRCLEDMNFMFSWQEQFVLDTRT